MSTITPPVATGAYTAAGLANGNPNRIGLISMQLAMAGFFVPFVFIYQPDLLITENANALMTCFTFLVTALGLVMLSAALEGVFFRRIGTFQRLLYATAAVALILPHTMISVGGLIVAVLLIGWDYTAYRRAGAEA